MGAKCTRHNRKTFIIFPQMYSDITCRKYQQMLRVLPILSFYQINNSLVVNNNKST